MDILNFEFPNIDRDLHIVTPVNLYLRKYFGLKIKTKNLHNALFYVLIYRPKLVYISNAHGDESTFKLIRFLHTINVNVVTLVTEGNFQESFIHGYLWGWNTDFKLYQRAMILWNEHSRNAILKFHPELKPQLEVSGATGFDRYFFLKFNSKQEFLEKQNLPFKKVIGIAGFGLFDHLDNYKLLKTVIPDISLEAFELFKEDLIKLRKIYKELIEQNPDILFILRMHPQLVSKLHRSEFSECVGLKNIFISSTFEELPNIADAINVSDLWIGYESTTSIEAWLLKKMVVYINPTTADFQRENHYKGCLIVKDVPELQNLIDKFYLEGIPNEYHNLAQIRSDIIKTLIEHDDGLNHKRAAEIIYKFYRESKRPTLSSLFRILREIRWIEVVRFYLYGTKWYFKLRRNLSRPDSMYPRQKDQSKQYESLYEQYI